MAKKKLVSYDEARTMVAQKAKSSKAEQGRVEQVDEIVGLLNSMKGYAPVVNPLRKAKSKAAGRKARGRK